LGKTFWVDKSRESWMSKGFNEAARWRATWAGLAGLNVPWKKMEGHAAQGAAVVHVSVHIAKIRRASRRGELANARCFGEQLKISGLQVDAGRFIPSLSLASCSAAILYY
jgi:hypothetical protein